MRHHIRMTPEASRDIDQCAGELASQGHGLERAMSLLDAMENDCIHLAARHEIGRRVESEDPGFGEVRSWAVLGHRSHLLLYRPTQSGIEILRVLHRPRNEDVEGTE